MGIFDQLTAKPWLDEGEVPEGLGQVAARRGAIPQFALKLFLAVATVLFTLFFVTYFERLIYSDWRPMPEPWLLWLNTAILVAGSIGMQRAWKSADEGDMAPVRTGLAIGGGCAVAFLVGQSLVWQNLMSLGYYATTNPANAFFYVMTVLHALHVLGGCVAWVRTAGAVWQQDSEIANVRVSVEMCAIYWHFLLVIWGTMFALLLLT